MAPKSSFLDRMVDRLYASISSGPSLNCRPHASRQRIDLAQLAKLDGSSAEDLLRALLGAEATVKISAKTTTPEPAGPVAVQGAATTGTEGAARAADSAMAPPIEDASLRAARRKDDDNRAILQKLATIAEDARTFEQDTGAHVLHLGFPLLSLPPKSDVGKVDLTKRILAPVAFVPVRLEVKKGRISSVTLACAAMGADRVQANPSLLAWIEKQTGTRFEGLFTDDDGADPWRELNAVVAAVCKALDLEVPPPICADTLALRPTPRADDEDAKKAAVLPSAIVGLYPLSNQSLLRDMQAIAGADELAGLVQNFVKVDAGLGGPESTPKVARVLSGERLVGAADPCQARAVRIARTSAGLVVHGPPGTGKSQTITNIIGDHLARGERVLFVCDKRTALDVVQHRLEHLGLGDLCAVVHDSQADQRALYLGIRDQLEALPEAKPEPGAVAELAKVDAELQRLHDELTRYHRALAEPGAGGAEPSFHELVGDWMATEPAAGIEPGVVNGLSPGDLTAIERDVRETLERALAASYPTNPWRETIGIALGAFVTRSGTAWRASVDELVAAAREADGARHEAMHPFEPERDVTVQATARTALADRLVTASQRLALDVLAAWAGRPPEDVAAAVDRLGDAEKHLALVRAGPLDAELSTIQKSAPMPLATQVQALTRLDAYLESAPKWWGGFAMTTRREAREELQRFGLTLTAPNAARLRACLDGLRARTLLAALAQEVLGTQASRLSGDTALVGCFDGHRALFEALRMLVDAGLGTRGSELREALGSAAARDALVAGLRAAARRAETMVRLESAVVANPLFVGSFLTALSRRLREHQACATQFESLARHLGTLENMIRLRDALGKLAPGARSCVEVLAHKAIGGDAGWTAFRHAALAGMIGARLLADPALLDVDAARIDATHGQYAALEARKRELVRTTVLHVWRERQRQRLLAMTGTRLNGAGAELKRRLATKGARAMRLRQVVQLGAKTEGGDPLLDLRPVWMASPEAVASVFPREAVFDVAIFDEASQCRLEEALPVLTRARRVVIAGDPRQLPPTRFFESTIAQSAETEAETDQELFEEQQAEVEDLLGAALNLEIEQCFLDVHYRSRNSDLIEFSNRNFYDSRLQAIPGHPKHKARQAPLHLVPVPGVYEERANVAEAAKVVEIVRELLARQEVPSIGIACFNLTQRDAILDALDQAAALDAAFGAKLAAARQRRGSGSFEGLFVKNLENVQGDERDHMIISTTYGPDAKGRFYRRFGPLGRAGGGRRLNVLVTRARDEVHLVTSIPAEIYRALAPLEPGQAPNGAWLLFSYLRYAEDLQGLYEREARRLAEAQVVAEGTVSERASETPSTVARALARNLATAAGISTDVCWGNDGFCVDLALHHPHRAEDVTIGVQCDGTRFDQAEDPVEWELFRSAILAGQGWKMLRTWTPQLFRDQDAEQQRVLDAVQAFLAAERHANPVPSASIAKGETQGRTLH